MTVIVNLYGAPSSGKSSAAAALFSVMKSVLIQELFKVEPCGAQSVEMVSEYAKELAWQGIHITKEMQQSIADVQMERERRLLGKVDYIITDSPVVLSPFYEQIYHETQSTKSAINTYISNRRENGHMSINFMLDRVTPYNPEGRYETEEESDQVGGMLRSYLRSWNIDCINVSVPQPERTTLIFNHIMRLK